MRTRASEELEELLTQADRSRLCLCTTDSRCARNLQRAVVQGWVVSPQRGLFALAATWRKIDPFEQARRMVRTLALLHPEWVFAGPSAAVFQGLSVSNRDVRNIFVACTEDCHTKKTNLTTRVFVKGDEPSVIDGVRMTSFARTVFDCMRMRGFRRGLAVADSALRVSGWGRDRLADEVERRFAGYRGIALVRDIVRYADGRAENGGESMARAAMIELGYEVPDLQKKVTDPIDGSEFYADYYWTLGSDDVVAGELDGHLKYVDPEMTGGRDTVEVLAEERLRESRIAARGIRIMRFSYKDSQNDERFRRILDAFGIPKRSS